jgi:PBSX family phage terminase large subunit
MMLTFKKTDKQKQATKILAGPAQNVALFGGSRSGKTFLIIYCIIVRAIKVKSRHVILRKNFNAVKRSIWLDTFPKVMRLCFPQVKVEDNKTDYYVTFPNGSEIFFGGLDDGERSEKILGQEFSTIYFNECSQIDYSSIQIAITRLAEKNDLKKRIWYDFNPPNKTHWSYYLFEKKLNPLDDEPINNPDDYISYLINPQDNIENLDEDYLKILESMPEKERNRFLHGLFNDESNGQVYYAFRRERHVKEVRRTYGTIFVGMDFNVAPMTAVIFQYTENKFRVIDEVYLDNSDTFKMADELKRRGYGGLRVIPDSTGRNRKTSGQSDFQILTAAGFVVESTLNPFITDRINNVNRILSADRIEIDHKCKKLINDLEKVVWKDNKPDQSGAAKHLTHISDALGYGLHKLDPLGLSQVQFTSSKR